MSRFSLLLVFCLCQEDVWVDSQSFPHEFFKFWIQNLDSKLQNQLFFLCIDPSCSLNCIHMVGEPMNQSASLASLARVWFCRKQKATVNNGSSRCSKNAATWAILLDLDNISLVKEEQRKALKTLTYSRSALAKIWLSTVEHCGSQRAVMRINCRTSYK